VRYAEGFALLGRGEYERGVAALTEASAGDPLVADAGSLDVARGRPLDVARGRPHREAMARAAAAFRDGAVEAAVTALTAAIALAPDRAEPHRILGHVYAADRQDEAAIEAFRQAVALAPGDERARLGLADALVASGRVAAARDALHETLTVLPASGRARYALARAYQRESLFEEALRELDAAVRFQPLLGLNGLFGTIGSLHVARLDLDAAITAYGARVDLHPNDADAHYDLGDVYLRQGRHDEARAELTLVLLLDPWHADAAASLAQTHLRRQDYAAAADAARRALELDPEDSEARYVLGTSLIRLGRVEDGQRELETLRRQQAEVAAARAHILEVEGLRRDAAVAIADGTFVEAVALRRKVLALDPSAFSHLELGLALLDAGQPEEAIERLHTAARMDGPFEVHRYLAEAYAAAGRQAESDRERATYERRKQEALRGRGGRP
jgi:tetratricopeptide (TPR) repeat protein